MQPFIKWAGGKRWLAPDLHVWMPPKFNKYLEPFLGGGAIFFHLQPKRAILSDFNAELIEAYRSIRDAPRDVEKLLSEHQSRHNDEYYYEVRALEPADPIEAAARFLYLNRTCWNGLYRVNLNGKFNVPRGTKNSIVIPGESFESISSVLKNVDLDSCDFEKTIDRAKHGDLVYVDPPYTVKHNFNGFLKYNQNIFSWNDQIRLRDACFAAKERGATVIVSNADHASVHDLYKGADVRTCMGRSSVIAGKSSARQNTTEFLAVLRGTA